MCATATPPFPPLCAKRRNGRDRSVTTDRATHPSVPHAEVTPPSPVMITRLLEKLERVDHEPASIVYAATATGYPGASCEACAGPASTSRHRDSCCGIDQRHHRGRPREAPQNPSCPANLARPLHGVGPGGAAAAVAGSSRRLPRCDGPRRLGVVAGRQLCGSVAPDCWDRRIPQPAQPPQHVRTGRSPSSAASLPHSGAAPATCAPSTPPQARKLGWRGPAPAIRAVRPSLSINKLSSTS
jgi:hypothetical protein